jgi:hypothetical protein
MITRRAFVLTAAIGLLAAASRPTLADPASANDPRSIVNAIYTRAALGKGDGGGGFLTASKSARARNLSQSLATLWLKADAHTPKGDVGPVDFDPVTNSQEPDVKSFAMTTESFGSERATIAVTMVGHNPPRAKPADAIVRYDFVRNGPQWKIDDIRGASDGEPWSIRGMLTDSLKN